MSDNDEDEKHLVDQGKRLAGRAVHFDKEQQPIAAIFYYSEAANVMEKLFGLTGKDAFLEYSKQYKSRADVLNEQREPEHPDFSVEPGQGDLNRANSLLCEALDLDESGQQDDAVTLYTEAVQICLEAKKITTDKQLQNKLAKIAVNALERAETIKNKPTKKSETGQTSEKNIMRPLGNLSLLDNDEAGGGQASAGARGNYSEEEIKVLKCTTVVNGREYVPFIAADLRERFAFPIPFTDPNGKLELSTKQRQRLKRWARAEEFIHEPKMLQIVDCYSIKQTIVSDCSFVASIAISAQYEKKFKKKLITSVIYPQNKKGEPVYNPCGKYMVKLHINGVPRKIIVDDYFPLGNYNEMLCSYSSNKSELWISILEKAYMKVMGGYDFPGSNSNIDMYALTGWIPERVAIRPNDPTFNADAVFDRLHDRFHRGDVLATVATGELSDALADRAGLVTTHAYAVLDVRKVKGEQLFLLKNPWAHLRWKGNWSELDTRHWTKEFQTLLNYNPEDAANFDNGVFWIDYKSMQQYFDVLYLNWSPHLFQHNTVIHQLWRAGSGPAKDVYNIGENPQFSLEIRDCSNGGAVWILLSRHITEIADFRDNKEYITLLVYKNNGNRVHYPFDPPPFIDGVRINSPHYLTKMVLPKGENVRRFTLVVSQFEKTATIFFSVRAYSNQPFSLEKVKNPFRNKKELTGQWSGRSAGGCSNNSDTWPNNPRFKLTVDTDSQIQIEMKGPKVYQIGFDLITTSAKNTASPHYFKKKSSGIYRPGFVIVTLDVVAGTYDILPSTFKAGQEGHFFISVASTASFVFSK